MSYRKQRESDERRLNVGDRHFWQERKLMFECEHLKMKSLLPSYSFVLLLSKVILCTAEALIEFIEDMLYRLHHLFSTLAGK